MKEKSKNSSPWRLYMGREVGQKGYYISANQVHFFGPFKSKKIAEFFNLLSFGDPRSLNLQDRITETVEYFNYVEKAEHPSNLIASNSKFSLWWKDIFEKPFSSDLALKLARETGAQGYQAFRSWLINGSQLDGRHVMSSKESPVKSTNNT